MSLSKTKYAKGRLKVVSIWKILWLWGKTLDKLIQDILFVTDCPLVLGYKLYIEKRTAKSLFYLNKLNAIFVLDSNKSINPFCAVLN